uniref:Kelch-like protein 18 n=1 Tax=Schistocephalus solidus TaxID=70667 RepID=A0A0X3NUL5_SCHSO
MAEAVIFGNGDFAQHYPAFNELRRDGDFIDVHLRSGELKIPAHRLILASRIPYFRQLVDGRLPADHDFELILDEVSPSILEAFVEYAYTGQMAISLDNLLETLRAAIFLDVATVRDFCRQVIESQELKEMNTMRTRW